MEACIAVGVLALIAGTIIGIRLDLYASESKAAKKDGKLQNYAAISEAELLTQLLGAPGSPVYLAVRAVIDEETTRLMNDALEDDLTEAALRFRLGGAAALTDVKNTIEEKIQEAKRRQEERELATDETQIEHG